MINYQCNFHKLYLQMSFTAEYHNDRYAGNIPNTEALGSKVLQNFRGGLKNWTAKLWNSLKTVLIRYSVDWVI